MGEKKQTNKLSYSTAGKCFRGFLCMVTFCAFCVGVIMSIYAIDTYGPEIVVEPEERYYDTAHYQNQLFYEIANTLFQCNQFEEYDISNSEFSIMDVSEQRIHFYSKRKIGEDVYGGSFSSQNLEELSGYKTSELVLDNNFMEYSQIKNYIEFNTTPCDYLYYNDQSFRNLFEIDGLQNTNHRFSDTFSENAYFIFENYELDEEKLYTLKTIIDKEQQEAAGRAAEEVYDTNIEVEEEASTEVTVVPYNLTSYAVYDPAQDLFYSTWDDFFTPMDAYIYNIDEVRSYIQGEEAKGKEFKSLIFPLLHSFNYDLSVIAGEFVVPYENMINAQNYLNRCEGRGIHYYLKRVGEKTNANVKNVQEIKDTEEYYYFEKKESGEVKQTHGTRVTELKDMDCVEEEFAGYPVGTVFCIGFIEETADMPLEQPASIIRNNREYGWFADNSLYVAILTVVLFILLMIQAVWLIRTTGRTCKGDAKVELNFFDSFYTEFWAVICIAIMMTSIYEGLAVWDIITRTDSIIAICLYTILGTLPFGFCFMVLTLSFARRVKAHNIWHNLIVYRIVKGLLGKKNSVKEEENENVVSKKQPAFVAWISTIWMRCRNFLCNMKGTHKLLLFTIVYLVFSSSFTYLAFLCGSRDDMGVYGLLMFVVIQVIFLLVMLCLIKDTNRLINGVKEITKGNLDYKIEVNEKTSLYKELADGINHTGDGLKSAIETSLKDERMKTELITNVSHDLKTPLTSIINYINLLKTEKMPTPEAEHYIEVLDTKAQRLKQLTEDLVEAAKATSGNIELEMMPLTFDELMKQALGEFEDKFEKKSLAVVASYPEEPAVVLADGRRMFRIIENVLQNAYKYALEGTRIYADLSNEESVVIFTLKNISAAPLNISPEELMERFTRGDASRTTEGSGLGLSIAKDLTRLQGGTFDIFLDGDLFKVIIKFPKYK